jgi:hypothetical protein
LLSIVGLVGFFVPGLALAPQAAMVLAESQVRTEVAFGIEISAKTQALSALIASHLAVGWPMLQAVGNEARRRAAATRARTTQAGLHAFGGARPDSSAAPSVAPSVAPSDDGNVVIFPTGAPDGGIINFGPA